MGINPRRRGAWPNPRLYAARGLLGRPQSHQHGLHQLGGAPLHPLCPLQVPVVRETLSVSRRRRPRRGGLAYTRKGHTGRKRMSSYLHPPTRNPREDEQPRQGHPQPSGSSNGLQLNFTANSGDLMLILQSRRCMQRRMKKLDRLRWRSYKSKYRTRLMLCSCRRGQVWPSCSSCISCRRGPRSVRLPHRPPHSLIHSLTHGLKRISMGTLVGTQGEAHIPGVDTLVGTQGGTHIQVVTLRVAAGAAMGVGGRNHHHPHLITRPVRNRTTNLKETGRWPQGYVPGPWWAGVRARIGHCIALCPPS